MSRLRSLFKVMMAVLLIGGGVVTVSFLQNRFDEGDEKRALAAVRAKFPGLQSCEATVVSRLHGHVRVRCGEEEWIVDVVRGLIEEGRGSQ